jgi:hypothetical protein
VILVPVEITRRKEAVSQPDHGLIRDEDDNDSDWEPTSQEPEDPLEWDSTCDDSELYLDESDDESDSLLLDLIRETGRTEEDETSL